MISNGKWIRRKKDGMKQSEYVQLPFLLRLIRHIPFPHKLGILERIFGRRVAQLGTARVALANGVTWKLDMTESCHRWLVYGDYEGPHTIAWIKKWLTTGGIVVDSGANIGQMLVYFATQPNVQVFAFEPNDEAADWLQECLAYYPEWKVKIIRKGFDNMKTTRIFQVAGAMSTTRLDWYVNKSLKKSSINVVRLDDYMFEHGVNRIRLWKIDVEGAEVAALQGATKMLSNRAIDALFIELSKQTYPDVKALLSAYGYKLYNIGGKGKLLSINDDLIQGTTNIVAVAQG
jgi:FkbM family methyltransferase